MDDLLQIIVYVVFFLIYLVSKVLNKKKKQPVTRLPNEETQRDFDDPDRPRRGFEDLPGAGRSAMDEPEERHEERRGTFGKMLRELTDADAWERRFEEESPYRRKTQKAQEEIREIQDRVEQSASYPSLPRRPASQKPSSSLKKKIQDMDKMTDNLRKEETHQNKAQTTARKVAQSLKDPASARQAIILGEILNRKHF